MACSSLLSSRCLTFAPRLYLSYLLSSRGLTFAPRSYCFLSSRCLFFSLVIPVLDLRTQVIPSFLSSRGLTAGPRLYCFLSSRCLTFAPRLYTPYFSQKSTSRTTKTHNKKSPKRGNFEIIQPKSALHHCHLMLLGYNHKSPKFWPR